LEAVVVEVAADLAVEVVAVDFSKETMALQTRFLVRIVAEYLSCGIGC